MLPNETSNTQMATYNKKEQINCEYLTSPNRRYGGKQAFTN